MKMILERLKIIWSQWKGHRGQLVGFLLVLYILIGSLIYGLTSIILDLRIAIEGRHASAKVLKIHDPLPDYSSPAIENGATHPYTYDLSFDNNVKTIGIAGPIRQVSTLDILYLPSDPSQIRLGNESTSVWEMLWQQKIGSITFGMAAITILIGGILGLIIKGPEALLTRKDHE
jgi:hypothetical protein